MGFESMENKNVSINSKKSRISSPSRKSSPPRSTKKKKVSTPYPYESDLGNKNVDL